MKELIGLVNIEAIGNFLSNVGRRSNVNEASIP